MSAEFTALFVKVIADEEPVEIKLDTTRDANNLRQQLYRFREVLRKDEDNPLALLVDRLTFSLRGPTLEVSYSPPPKPLMEVIQDERKSLAN